jgi:hypothetical protein
MNPRARVQDQLELILKNVRDAGADMSPKRQFALQLALLEVYRRGGDDRVSSRLEPEPERSSERQRPSTRPTRRPRVP